MSGKIEKDSSQASAAAKRGGTATTVLYAPLMEADRISEAEFSGFLRYARTRGWRVETLGKESISQEKVREAVAQLNPAGCVAAVPDDRTDLPPRLFGGAPVVYLHAPASYLGGKVARVSVDNDAIARVAFRELSAGRPSAYAFISSIMDRTWSRERGRTFRTLVEGTGLPFFSFRFGRFDSDETRAEKMAAFVASLPRRCATFAAADPCARVFASACRAAGRLVPRDISIIGVDDNAAICSATSPSLSSIRIDHERAGFVAARMLDSLLSGWAGPPPSAKFEPLLPVRRESTRGSGRREPYILEAVESIRREACDGLSARDLAARFPGSRRLFDLRFREATGHSVLDEILHVRLEKAFALLARRDMPLSPIAAACGFKTNLQLHRLFLSRVGMSMSEWRRRNVR